MEKNIGKNNAKLLTLSQSFARGIDELGGYEERMNFADSYYQAWYRTVNEHSEKEEFPVESFNGKILELFRSPAKKSIFLFSPSLEEIKVFSQKFAKVFFIALSYVNVSLPKNVIQFKYDDHYGILTEEDYQREFCDYVFSSHVVEHIHPKDLKRHLEQIYGFLKPKGEYLFICPSGIRIKKDAESDTKECLIAANHHIGRYGYNEIASLAQEVGFRKTSCPLINPLILNLWIGYKRRFSEIILEKIGKFIPNIFLAIIGYNSLYIKLGKYNSRASKFGCTA